MILINLAKVNIDHFPDGTLLLKDMDYGHPASNDIFDVYWKFENNEEFTALQYIVMHIQDRFPDVKINLSMPYIPNARMDRIHTDHEVFTLKYFCKLINALNFRCVTVLDPHSDVSVALLDRLQKFDVSYYIRRAMDRAFEDAEEEDCVVYFPDAGSMKRYKDMNCFRWVKKFAYGEKVRDFDTGQIKGLKVNIAGDFSLEGKTVLMVDDICSYGGTFAYSADELKKLGAKDVYAYATHCENSVLDEEKSTLKKRLVNGTVVKLYTTDDLYTGKYEKIEIV